MAQATPTRRDVLRCTLAAAAGAGAALAVPGSVFASESSAKPEKALRWGIIGTGARCTRAHIPAIESFTDSMQIFGVCDVMENHLADGAKRAGGDVETFTDYQKLLAATDINAVCIATPNLLHKEMVIAALDAGKHVLCEKPMAVSIDECRAMKAAQEKHPDLVVLYAMQLRYAGVWSTFRSEIEKGTIGKPKHLLFAEFRGDWNRGDVWQYDDPKLGRKVNWRFSHAASGGTLNEKVCHYFDILNWMVGQTPQRVSCSGGISVYRDDGRDTWDQATTTLTYAGGVQATHSLCMFAPNRLDLQVIGDEGSLSFGRGEESLVLQPKKGKPQPIALPDEIRHGERGPTRGMETAVVKMYEDFLDCVRNGKKPWMDADKAMASSKTAWLGELSNEKKREVAWDEP
jgi:predicted dehydrogenase